MFGFSVDLVVGFVCGALFLFVVQAIIVYFLFFKQNNTTTNTNAPPEDRYTFPQHLLEIMGDKLEETEGTVLLNLLLQFWFHENRYDVNTLTAIGERINSELKELLANTHLWRVFHSLKIHDIELGSESPTISSVSLKNVTVNKELSTLENFVFEFDLKYVGGFYMAIDALMKFKPNMSSVSVKVAKCTGRVRVEFTRKPYTYWCMSFLNPPKLDLVVESRFKGRSVPQLNRIIGSQLRSRIMGKFVLPHYKIRSKPFLPTHNLINLKDDPNQTVPKGTLQIVVLTLSRLQHYEGSISCTLMIDHCPWIEAETTNNNVNVLQMFKRPKKEPSTDNRKLSTGAVWYVSHTEGLRQRLKSITGLEDPYSIINESLRRKSYTESTGMNQTEPLQFENDDLIFQTRKMPYSELITFNEQFTFDITPSFRYLNILVWNHQDNQGNIVGYVSAPLTNIMTEGIGKKRRIFYLTPANKNKNQAYQSLSTHTGFNPSLCAGDITIGVQFPEATGTLTPNDMSPINMSPTKIPSSPALSEEAANLSAIESEFALNVHEFEKMVVTTQTKCGFCNRKSKRFNKNFYPNQKFQASKKSGKGIWLKDASRCIKCGLVCHKKCVPKYEKSSECKMSLVDSVPDDEVEIASQAISINPEIITTAPENNSTTYGRNKLSNFLANVKGIRRSGSASSLAPPVAFDSETNQAHSLPPTPNLSPSPSRKPSMLMANVNLFESSETDDEVEKALASLQSIPHNEQFLELVKTSGKRLCTDLSPEMRQARIDEMIAKIKETIDAEQNKCTELLERMKSTADAHETTRLSFEIGKCDERMQSLTNLLLYCCSGLQDMQDKEIDQADK